MFKNVASQKLSVYVFDSTTNLPKTGDAANLTAYRSLDDGSVTVLGDTSATEQDSTNAKGFYIFDLTQAETNGDKIMFSCKSSTSNMVCLCMPAVVYTTPASFTSSVAQTGDSYARLGAPAGASVSADIAAVKAETAEIDAVTDQITFTVTNQIDVNVLDWKSATAPAMTGDAFARLGAPAGASVSADIAAVKTETAEIDAVTDQITFTVTNQVDVNVLDWKSSTAPAMTGDAFARLGAPAGASVSADVAAIKAETAEIDAVADQLVFTVPNQVDVNVVDWKGATAPAMTGDAFARLGAPAGASVSADIAAVKAETADIDANVDNLAIGVIVTTNNDKTGYALTVGERTAIADALLARALAAESYAADATVPTLSQALYMILQQGADFGISGTTLTVRKFDGTAAMTFTLDSSTAPTSRTRAT